MTVIYVLLVAHFVADFIAQSDWMAINKSKRWDALAWHVLVYSMVLGVFVAWSQPDSEYPYTSLKLFMLWWGVNAAAHFVQDAITSRITARLWFVEMRPVGKRWSELAPSCSEYGLAYAVRFTNKRHWFFVAIGADQLLHYITLFVTAEWWLR